jgi:hypothetical protein
MIQIRSRETKYRNEDKKQKATFHGRGFPMGSKTYQKSKNVSTVWIIEYNRRNCTLFFRQSGGEKNG